MITNYSNWLSKKIPSPAKSDFKDDQQTSKKSFSSHAWLMSIMLFFAIFVGQDLAAQSITNYAFTTGTTGSLEDLSTGATSLMTGNQDDTASLVLPIGFDFYFMGVKYTHFSANSNGQFKLHQSSTETAIAGGNITAPAASAPVLFPMAGDNEVNDGMKAKLVGTKLVIEWTQFYAYYTNITNAGNMQAWLSPDGKIEYVYGDIYNSNNATVARSIGISSSNTATTAGYVTLSATPTFTAAATFTTNTFAAGNGATTASPLIANLGSNANGSRRFFRFTPISTSPANPISMTFTSIGSSTATLNWLDNSTDETFFIVTRATDAAFTTGVVRTVVASTTTATTATPYLLANTGLAPSTLYYYRVVASNEAGVPLSGLTGSSTTSAPGLYISVVTGNWNTPGTWDMNAVPGPADNVTISTGNVVSIDVAGLVTANLNVNGTLDYGATPTSFSVNGNLTVNTGGVVNLFNATTGKTLNVSGNIVNNGTIDVSVGATTGGNLTLNGTTVQSVTGSGTFNTGVIRNLAFTNTSVATPNIIWSIDNVKVSYNLNLSGARINLGTNKMTFGNGAAGNSLTAPVGSGFMSGAKFSRWWANNATGSAITAGTDPTNATSRYPFIAANGDNRAMYITRSSSVVTGNTAGELAVTYTDPSGLANTVGLNITDGAYTITDKFNGKWTVTADAGYVYASGTHTVVLIAQNAYAALNGNSRVITDTAIAGGAHQGGTNTPAGQRTGMSTAELTTVSGLFLGINASDVGFISVTSGNWNSAATWNKGVVPDCTSLVQIFTGHTVTSNSVGNVSKNVTILSGGTLVQASGDLTVGCTLNNNSLVNNGTLTVSGGTLTVNGNVNNVTGSTLNQSGGEIIVDGNAAGVAANSVLTGTNIFRINTSNVTLTGGKITIVDPHVGAGATDFSFGYNQAAYANATVGHTLQFGNGTSTDATTNTLGFMVDPYVSSARLNFGNVVVNAGATGNRFVYMPEGIGMVGNLTINTGSEVRATGLYLFAIGGNLVNNGTFTSSIANLTFGAPSPTAIALLPVTVPQTISGTGVFRNSATTVTGNLAAIIVNNGNTLSLNVPLSVTTTLTLTSGIVNTTSANLLSLGTATAAGALVGGSATSYINGPFNRTFGIRTSAATYDVTTLFPVGKGAMYLPLHLAPTTTVAGLKLQAEASTTNSGTFQNPISSISQNRWEVTTTAGAMTEVFVRENDNAIASLDEILQAPTAAGVYAPITQVSTNVVGASLTSATAIAVADFTGFLSYGKKCVAPVAPTGTMAQTFCNAGTVSNLLATTVTGGTLVWYDAATAGNVVPSTTALVNGTSYFASQVVTGGCESATRFEVVATITTPVAPTGTAAQTFCSTNNPTIANLVATGSGIKWYAAPTLGTELPATTALVNGTIYYASQTIGTCESISRFAVTATVNITSCPNIEYANLQFPGTATILTGGSVDVYAQVFKAGVTEAAGQGANITAWIGYSTTNTDPSTWTNWTLATYNTAANAGNNDEYMLLGFGSTLPVGTYYYASRFQYNGAPYVYGGYSSTGGGLWGTTNVSGVLTVNCSTLAPTGAAMQGGTTLADLIVTPSTGITWYASQANALAGTGALPLSTVLVDNATYYAVQTTTCASAPFAVTIDFDLATTSFNLNSLKYYPNPVKDMLNLTYSENITAVKLYNTIGQQLMVKEVNSTETQVDMSRYPAGSYLLEVTVGDRSKMVKLMKN